MDFVGSHEGFGLLLEKVVETELAAVLDMLKADSDSAVVHIGQVSVDNAVTANLRHCERNYSEDIMDLADRPVVTQNMLAWRKCSRYRLGPGSLHLQVVTPQAVQKENARRVEDQEEFRA